MFTTTTHYQPSHGPSGEPYSVRSRFAADVTLSHHWTERDAMDARDTAFDQGARSVHVAGLPLRVVSAGFPVVEAGDLPEIAD